MPPLRSTGTGPEAEDPEYAGQYRLGARLGAGGMGVVHLARSPSGRRLAVKVVHARYAADPEFRARFRQEVAAARRVSGAFTAPVVDADPDGVRPWMATLYIPGPTLSERVKRNGPLGPAEVRRLAAGLAEALRDINRAGVVHRDLKPSNVLLADDGPKVIDFGISRPYDRPHDSELRTETGQLIGTPPFMAPEQFQRPRHVGPEADVFALGSLLVHAATGRGPFESESPYIVAYQVVHDEPDLTGVPEELVPLVRACLAKEPADRPTPDALMAELRSTPVGPVGPSTSPVRPSDVPVRTPDVPPVRSSAAFASPPDARPFPRVPVQRSAAEAGAGGGAPEEPSTPRRVVLARSSGSFPPAHASPVSPSPARRGRARLLAAGAVALLLVGAGAAWAVRSARQAADGTERPEARPTPVAAGWRPWESGVYEGASAEGGEVRATFCSYGYGALFCSGRGVRAARIDPADGRLVWKSPAERPGAGRAGNAGNAGNPGDTANAPVAPVLSGSVVQVVSRDGARLTALDPRTRQVRWTRDVSAYGGRVYHAGDTVLLVAADGTVTAVDSATNERRWSHRVAGQARPQFSSYGDGRVAYAVTPSPDGRRTRIAAVDPVRGTTLWQRESEGALTAAGTGPGGALFLTATAPDTRTSAVVRYDPATRAEHRVRLSAPVAAVSVATRGSMVYLLGAEGGLVAVDTARGGHGWRLETSVANASQLVAAEGRLYFSAADGRLLAVDTARHTLMGQTPPRLGRAGHGYLELVPAPVVADGRVYAAAPDGSVFAVDGREPARW
ncbi:PQQ-binding-like beta-propeller repeat protein [Streptomyces varsoviensis]|uniref:protein kinase domain-containing protein n=1 Tax=Streptomyces varsoviensis TaxID=67373 RepID=UPI0033C4E5C3